MDDDRKYNLVRQADPWLVWVYAHERRLWLAVAGGTTRQQAERALQPEYKRCRQRVVLERGEVPMKVEIAA